MATNIKGPALFLSRFASDEAPFNSLASIAQWAASLGTGASRFPHGTDAFSILKKLLTQRNIATK